MSQCVLSMFLQSSICRQFGLAWDNFGNAWVNNSSCIRNFKGGGLLIMKSVRRPISRVLSPPLRAMDGHSSGTSVARRLARPTRKAMRKPIRGPKPPAFPIRSCSRWGLPCHARHRARGALLPHPFTLTGRPRGVSAVCFLWHFPWGRPRRTLSGTVFP